ncbi:MAG: AraC family transcriptional regulator [Agathobacter sp.]
MDKLLFENYKTSEATETRRVICTPSIFTKRHFFYVQEAGYLKSRKPHLSRRFGLESYLFMIILSGSGTVTYKGERVNARQGDCFYIDCRNEYSHISSADDPWELLWIHFNGPSAEGYYNYFAEHNFWHFTPTSVQELTTSVQTLLSLHENRNENTDILAANEITQILTTISTEVPDSDQPTSALSQKLREIIAYLDEHYTEEISLDFLAEHFFISKFYLSREFKKEYGTTIVSYILIKRITNAKEQLRYGDSSIEEIALSCGIADASYFNKVFRKLEGCTASEYRKKWRIEK